MWLYSFWVNLKILFGFVSSSQFILIVWHQITPVKSQLLICPWKLWLNLNGKDKHGLATWTWNEPCWILATEKRGQRTFYLTIKIQFCIFNIQSKSSHIRKNFLGNIQVHTKSKNSTNNIFTTTLFSSNSVQIESGILFLKFEGIYTPVPIKSKNLVVSRNLVQSTSVPAHLWLLIWWHWIW